MNITVGTFNILDPDFAVKYKQKEGLTAAGKSNWNTRKDLIARKIENSNLDIMTLQEVSLTSFDDLSIDFQKAGYVVKHVPHSERTDGLAVLYKANKFTEKGFKVFTKHGMNSCYIDLAMSTGKIIRVATCHLLGGPKQDMGREQIEQVVQMVEKNGAEEIEARIITGDFNADATQLDSPSDLDEEGDELDIPPTKFTALKEAEYEFDGDLTPTEIAKNRRIDWIWVRSSSVTLSPLTAAMQTISQQRQEAASDHALAATQLQFKASVFQPAPLSLDPLTISVDSPLTQSPDTSPLPTPLSFYPYNFSPTIVKTDPEITPYQHTQPLGSFRAKIMDNFSVTGWDAALRRCWKENLDKILTQQANAKPFLQVVRQKYEEWTEHLFMTKDEKEILINDFEKAIAAAQKQSPSHTPASQPQPRVTSSPLPQSPLPEQQISGLNDLKQAIQAAQKASSTPSVAKTQPVESKSPISRIETPPMPPLSPSPKPAPKADPSSFLERIRGFLSTIANFFAWLFRMR